MPLSRKKIDNIGLFKTFEAPSIFKQFAIPPKPENLVVTFEGQPLGLVFPDHFYAADRTDVVNDIFGSLTGAGIPTYLVDFQTILVSKSAWNLRTPRARVCHLKSMEFFRDLKTALPDSFRFLVSLGRFMFPLYFLNESTTQVTLFACLEFSLNPDLSRSRVELVLFPFAFMNVVQENNGGPAALRVNIDDSDALADLLYRAQLENNVPPYSLPAHRREVSSSMEWEALIQQQQKLLKGIQKDRTKLVRAFWETHDSFLVNHRRNICPLCATIPPAASTLSLAAKLRHFSSKCERAWSYSEGRVRVHLAGQRMERINLEKTYPLIEPQFVSETIAFGSPFRVIIKRNTEGKDELASENDDLGIKSIEETHVGVHAAYLKEKRANFRAYREHCNNFDLDTFHRGIRQQANLTASALPDQPPLSTITRELKRPVVGLNGIRKDLLSFKEGSEALETQPKTEMTLSLISEETEAIVPVVLPAVPVPIPFASEGILEGSVRHFEEFQAVFCSGALAAGRPSLGKRAEAFLAVWRPKRLKTLAQWYWP